MAAHEILSFGDFTLDLSKCQLRRGGAIVPIKARYFDVLALLARNPGALITKDRFFEEVWTGTTVGDEALTQAIKELRKAIGDDAAAPRLIETVPRRGYRFIGEVASPTNTIMRPDRLDLVLAGMAGGAAAGLIGGMVYGVIAGRGNPSALIILAVMMVTTMLVATLGAGGLSVGMATASRLAGQDWRFSPLGAGLGGFIVGEAFHRLASGGFSLFLGGRHEAFTGGIEGLVLGVGIALGAQLVAKQTATARKIGLGGAIGGGLSGLMIGVLGGRLMASSLGALARRNHGSQLDLGMFGQLAADDGHATLLSLCASTAEGLLLGGLVAGAIARRLRSPRGQITE